MWQTDPCVNAVPLSHGDVQMKDNYRIYVAAALAAAERELIRGI